MNKNYTLCRFFCDPISANPLSSLRCDEEAGHFCAFELDTTPRIFPITPISRKRMIYNIDSLLQSTDVTIPCDELGLHSNASHHLQFFSVLAFAATSSYGFGTEVADLGSSRKWMSICWRQWLFLNHREASRPWLLALPGRGAVVAQLALRSHRGDRTPE